MCYDTVSAATKALIEAARKAGVVTRKTASRMNRYFLKHWSIHLHITAADYLKLSLTQAKRMEMDAQVRVLELEASLSQERERLGQLRRAHYHLAGEAEV